MMDLYSQLKRDEGVKPYAYKDSEGYWTVGAGFCIDQTTGNGLLPNEIDFILRNRVERVRAECSKIPQLNRLDPVRLDAIINMAYNLGIGGLLKFPRMLDALSRADWQGAAREMVGSKWAAQVGDRSNRLAKQILTGEYQ